MKKAILIMLSVAITLFFVCPAGASEEISVYLDDQKIEFDQPPIVLNDRTLVPMRALFEALGASVEWDEESQTATGKVQGIDIEITLGEDFVLVNMVKLILDCQAQKINDRVLVPLRVVSESFGVDVQWDERSNSVIMKNKNIIRTINDGNFIYEGMIQNEKLNGYGTTYYSNGKLHSKGFYSDNVLQEGCYFWVTGEYFKGKFKDWKLNGDDCFYTYNGFSVLGKFVDNIPTGKVFMKYKNGESYLGETNGFERNGQGNYYYNSGCIYVGSWSNGETNGEGTYYFEDGESYLHGTFTEGATINGFGEYYDYPNNCLYTGFFSNGKMDGEFTIYCYNTRTVSKAYFKNGEMIVIGQIGTF